MRGSTFVVQMLNHVMTRSLRLCVAGRICPIHALVTAFFIAVFLTSPLRAQSFDEQAQEAAIEWADEQAHDYVAEKTGEAIKALIKRLKSATNNDLLLEKLENTALGAAEIDELTQKFASGEPDQIEEASQELAVTMAGWLKDAIEDEGLKEAMSELLDSTDKINEIVEVLGKAAGGDMEAALEFVGSTIIEMTPAAGVISVYQNAYGAMEYAHDTYVDSEMESLYKEFVKQGLSRKELEEKLSLAPYTYLVRDRIISERRDRIDELGDAIGHLQDGVRDRMVSPTDDKIAAELFAGFRARQKKDLVDAEARETAKRSAKQASIMYEWLDWYARQKFGDDWSNKSTDAEVYDLTTFADGVRRALAGDGVLNPDNPTDITLMASARAAWLTFGRDSEEYKVALEKLELRREFIRQLNGKAPPAKNRFDGLYVGTQTMDGDGFPATVNIKWPKAAVDVNSGEVSWVLVLESSGNSIRVVDDGWGGLQPCSDFRVDKKTLYMTCTLIIGSGAEAERTTITTVATRR